MWVGGTSVLEVRGSYLATDFSGVYSNAVSRFRCNILFEGHFKNGNARYRFVTGPLRIWGILEKRLAALCTCGSPFVSASSPLERPKTRLSSSTLIFSFR